ncbi:MAG: translation elongation factor Ts [Bacteroidota bacterium]
MAITAQDVNKLRQMTGAGMMDCKKALTEANGDFEAAVDYLRKKGQKVSAARADRQTSEGAVFIKTSADGTKGLLISLGCETDFVAKTDDFVKLGNTVLEAADSSGASTPEALNEVQVEGRPISDLLTDLVGKIGEKVEVLSVERVEGEKVTSYIHSNGKLGVLVAFTGANGADVTESGKDVALQIAAMKPIAVDKDQVDATTVEREIEVGREQARNEGKAEAMLDKIAQGRLAKFYKENTLLNQEFVKDPSKTVGQVLSAVSKGLTVKEFKRVAIGA